jgi:hypothetical protein
MGASLGESFDRISEKTKDKPQSASLQAMGRSISVGHRDGVDLYVFLDESGSMENMFDLAKQFIIALVNKVRVSERIGRLVVYVKDHEHSSLDLEML